MGAYFLRKLLHGAPLSPGDRAALDGLCGNLRHYPARQDIAREEATWRTLKLVVDGWAIGYKQLPDGKRQIVRVFVPGDLCEPYVALPETMDYAIAAITPVTVAHIALDGLKALFLSSPLVEQALQWDLLLSWAMDRDALVSLGRRTGPGRIGHLFCELHQRLSLIGLVDDDSFDFPLTQYELADIAGVTAVHVNRSLQDLRAAGLISLRERHLRILDLDGLKAASQFDPGYLQVRVYKGVNHAG